MDSNSKISMVASSSAQRSRRLVFDRRYGWVFDEWKDPSEDALAGGRGMFCILPLAKAILKTASETINLAACSTVKVLEKPELFFHSVEALQASLNDQLCKFKSSLPGSEFNTFSLKGGSPSSATRDSPDLP